MPPRRHSADLRGRRQDLGIGVRDMAAGLGIELRRLLAMEDGTASEEDKTSIARGSAASRLLASNTEAPIKSPPEHFGWA